MMMSKTCIIVKFEGPDVGREEDMHGKAVDQHAGEKAIENEWNNIVGENKFMEKMLKGTHYFGYPAEVLPGDIHMVATYTGNIVTFRAHGIEFEVVVPRSKKALKNGKLYAVAVKAADAVLKGTGAGNIAMSRQPAPWSLFVADEMVDDDAMSEDDGELVDPLFFERDDVEEDEETRQQVEAANILENDLSALVEYDTYFGAGRKFFTETDVFAGAPEMRAAPKAFTLAMRKIRFIDGKPIEASERREFDDEMNADAEKDREFALFDMDTAFLKLSDVEKSEFARVFWVNGEMLPTAHQTLRYMSQRVSLKSTESAEDAAREFFVDEVAALIDGEEFVELLHDLRAADRYRVYRGVWNTHLGILVPEYMDIITGIHSEAVAAGRLARTDEDDAAIIAAFAGAGLDVDELPEDGSNREPVFDAIWVHGALVPGWRETVESSIAHVQAVAEADEAERRLEKAKADALRAKRYAFIGEKGGYAMVERLQKLSAEDRDIRLGLMFTNDTATPITGWQRYVPDSTGVSIAEMRAELELDANVLVSDEEVCRSLVCEARATPTHARFAR